jgi:hypothetical protein
MFRRGLDPFGSWIAREVILFRSELRPDGARHEALARYPLGPSDWC